MIRTATILVAAALVVTACQSASEQLSEQLAEQVEGVTDVDIDIDTGQIKIETDDGSMTIGGGELPDGFAVPLPDGYKVTSVFTTDDGSVVGVSYPQDRYDELVAHFDEWTSSQPEDWDTATMTLDQGTVGTMRSSSYYTSDMSIQVTDCFDVGAETGVLNAACVNILNG